MDCNKQLEKDVADIQGKANRLSQLTAEVDSIAKERETLQNKINELQGQLQKQQEEKNQAVQALEQFKARVEQEKQQQKEEPPKEEPPKEEPPKQEPPKQEPPKEEPKPE